MANGTPNIKRLVKAVEWSRRKLKPFRQNRLSALASYAGKHYGDGPSDIRVPINMIEMAVNIYTQNLAARNPQVLATTPSKQYKSSAETLRLGINHLLNEIRAVNTFRTCVRGALFSVGLCKVGLDVGKTVEWDGFRHDVGQPFADPISLDDWVHDCTATNFEQTGFSGNRYRIPLEIAKDDERYDKKAREKLVRTSMNARDEAGERTDASLARSEGDDPDEFHDHTEFWDIWLPLEGLIVTLPTNDSGGESSIGSEPLRVIEWDGPENGPYHQLGFADVDGSAMPLPPVATWMDIHRLSNRIFTKVGDQALRRKQVVAFQDAQDAIRLKEAGDGDGIHIKNPGAMKETVVGGFDPQSWAFTLQLQDMFSKVAGNLDLLGGLGAQSPTATQDQILASASSKRMEDMQDRTAEFVRGIVKDLAWYLWTDPLIELPLIKRVKGSDIQIPVSFNAEQREGDFLDYNITIEPYSMQHQSPGSKLQSLMGLMQSFIIPAMPLMESQGIGLDFNKLFDLMADYGNLPELKDILVTAEAPEGGLRQKPPGPTVTNRTTTRQSRPSGTPRGEQENTMRMMMATQNQESEV